MGPRGAMFRVMARLARFTGTLIAAGVLLGVGGIYFLWFLSSLDRVGAQSVSPDGRFLAQVVEGNWGATTPFTTEVLLIDQGVFPPFRLLPPVIAGTQQGVFAYYGRLEAISITWQDDRHLVIYRPAYLRVYGQQDDWRGVDILYVERTPE